MCSATEPKSTRIRRMYCLAQINIARFRTPIHNPENVGFVSQLDRVNAEAESQPGFIWRLTGSGNNALDVKAFEDPDVAVNMSVWKDVASLHAFVYRHPAHLDIMRRRREWFDALDFHMALWWVEAGHKPAISEGRARLEALAANGPSEVAFLFNSIFPVPRESNG